MTESVNSDTLARRIWCEWRRAVTDRDHGWRTPVLASVDGEGAPSARTLVLRGVDEAEGMLCCYTDHRSAKVGQLRAEPRVALVFWCPRLRWQLRAAGTADVDQDSERVAAAWSQIAQEAGAGDYLAPLPPGTPLDEDHSEVAARPETSPRAHALGIITVHVQAMDWLELNTDGHRRARVTEAGVCWIMP